MHYSTLLGLLRMLSTNVGKHPVSFSTRFSLDKKLFDWKDKFNLSALLSCFSPIIILMWQCICSVSLFKGIYCSVVLSWGVVIEEELDGL